MAVMPSLPGDRGELQRRTNAITLQADVYRERNDHDQPDNLEPYADSPGWPSRLAGQTLVEQ